MPALRLTPAELRRALAADGTSLQYQAQVHVPSSSLAGVEAFVRWPHPAFGMIGPSEIVALVEEGGLHAEFDAWVVGAACAQAQRWRAEGVPLPLVSVNVWAQTMRQGQLAPAVTSALQASGVPPAMLEIETPRGAAADAELATVLELLRRLGVRIASEARAPEDLPSISVDTVKIPARAVAEIDDGERRASIGRLAAACRDRGVRLVAEGVETAAQRDALLAAGCEIVQGYLYGPEVSAAEVSALARTGDGR